MLDENNLHAEECYTIQWRESKYTLANLSKKQRHSTIINRLKVLKAKYNVIESQIIGYESLAGHHSHAEEPRLDQHPGFQRLIDVLNTDLASLKTWMKEKDVMSNKRGLLWPFIETLPTDQASTAQLKRMVDKWRPMVKIFSKQSQGNAEVCKPSFSTTRSILFRYEHDKSARNMMKEVLRMENKLNASESSDRKEGEIYAAWNPLTTNLHKLGFTSKDAETRVKALQTAGVLEPFQLVRHAHVPDAR